MNLKNKLDVILKELGCETKFLNQDHFTNMNNKIYELGLRQLLN